MIFLENMEAFFTEESEHRDDLEYECTTMLLGFVKTNRFHFLTKIIVTLQRVEKHTVGFEEISAHETLLREESESTFEIEYEVLWSLFKTRQARVELLTQVQLLLTLEERFYQLQQTSFGIAMPMLMEMEEDFERCTIGIESEHAAECNMMTWGRSVDVWYEERYLRTEVWMEEDEAFSHVAILEDTAIYVHLKCASSAVFLAQLEFLEVERRAREGVENSEVGEYVAAVCVPYFVSQRLNRASDAQHKSHTTTGLTRRFVDGVTSAQTVVFQEEYLDRDRDEYEQTKSWDKEVIGPSHADRLHAVQREEIRIRMNIESIEVAGSNDTKFELVQLVRLFSLGLPFTLDLQEWSNRQMIDSYEARDSALLFACEAVQVEETALRGGIFSQEYMSEMSGIQREEWVCRAASTSCQLLRMYTLTASQEVERFERATRVEREWRVEYERLRREHSYYVAALSSATVRRDFYHELERMSVMHEEGVARCGECLVRESDWRWLVWSAMTFKDMPGQETLARLAIAIREVDEVCNLAMGRMEEGEGIERRERMLWVYEGYEAGVARAQLMCFEGCLFTRMVISHEESLTWMGIMAMTPLRRLSFLFAENRPEVSLRPQDDEKRLRGRMEAEEGTYRSILQLMTGHRLGYVAIEKAWRRACRFLSCHIPIMAMLDANQTKLRQRYYDGFVELMKTAYRRKMEGQRKRVQSLRTGSPESDGTTTTTALIEPLIRRLSADVKAPQRQVSAGRRNLR